MHNLDFSIEYLLIDGNISSIKNHKVKLPFLLLFGASISKFTISPLLKIRPSYINNRFSILHFPYSGKVLAFEVLLIQYENVIEVKIAVEEENLT